MSSSTKLSASGKYQVEFLPDPSGCMRTTTTTNYGSAGYTKTEQWPKYRLVRLTNLVTQTTVFEFKQFTSHPLDCQFFVQSGVEWFFGSREYQSQLFVNLETGDYYDNCTQDYLDDSEYERKHKFDNSAARNDLFIWVRTCIEPNGMYAVVDGCYWGNSYEDRVYDLSRISSGWRPIDIELCDRLHMTPDGVIQCYIEGKLVMEATVVDGEISDLGTVTGYAEALQAQEEADY